MRSPEELRKKSSRNPIRAKMHGIRTRSLSARQPRAHAPRVPMPIRPKSSGMSGSSMFWMARAMQKDEATAQKGAIMARAGELKSSSRLSDIDLVSDKLDELHETVRRILEGGMTP